MALTLQIVVKMAITEHSITYGHIGDTKLVKTVSSTTDQHIPSENMNTSTTLRDDSGADEETEDWDDLAEEHVTYRVACFFEKLKAQSITYSATNYMVK